MLLETERLIIRKMEDRDIDEIFDYRNDERCYKFQSYSSKTKKELQSLIKISQDSKLNRHSINQFAIVLKENDNIVGEIYINVGEDNVAIGYTISYKHFRKGYAYEALSKLVLLLHELYPEYEILGLVHPGNEPSNNLLIKLGFVNEEFIEEIDSFVFTKYSLKEREKKN